MSSVSTKRTLMRTSFATTRVLPATPAPRGGVCVRVGVQ
jgi:hypothetical protein